MPVLKKKKKTLFLFILMRDFKRFSKFQTACQCQKTTSSLELMEDESCCFFFFLHKLKKANSQTFYKELSAAAVILTRFKG